MKNNSSRKTSFGYRFAMIQRIHTALLRDGMLTLGITTAQFPFLAELFHEQRPVTQDELSKALCIDPAATARALDQLEKKGLVNREINPENRRQKLVSITPLALEMKPGFYEVLNTASDALVTGLSGQEKKAALSLLDRIMANGITARHEKNQAPERQKKGQTGRGV
ncbi:MarR family winged helix-turn-helix transcriptional regulator [Desulfoluna spongiiphila]|uniref:MarR family winged helix-turn-helix transcriptional regulator n=1 Tax=Desulfoluna spongiiphila TaxID=419481 RepID=UPI0012596097|nr:MarR family transcriptional regulator [Desulfoluna spongiiphila]VVS90937.1 consensus disorder prediction [Desulfoluna spongiiphila]